MLLTNPLGLVISYLYEDQAFGDGCSGSANAVFVATLIFLTLGFWFMREVEFLVPWRSLILHDYLQSIALYCALLFANILGIAIWIERKFFLRDTGRKLRHLDQEIHTGESELSERLLLTLIPVE
jgi:hypothetical protein